MEKRQLLQDSAFRRARLISAYGRLGGLVAKRCADQAFVNAPSMCLAQHMNLVEIYTKEKICSRSQENCSCYMDYHLALCADVALRMFHWSDSTRLH